MGSNINLHIFLPDFVESLLLRMNNILPLIVSNDTNYLTQNVAWDRFFIALVVSLIVPLRCTICVRCLYLIPSIFQAGLWLFAYKYECSYRGKRWFSRVRYSIDLSVRIKWSGWLINSGTSEPPVQDTFSQRFNRTFAGGMGWLWLWTPLENVWFRN